MILSSRPFLYWAFDKMPSSTFVAVISRNTRTSCFCPILWALSLACSSIWGFQSESKMITVSDTCRFSPWPPALVERTNTFSMEFGSENLSRQAFLSSCLVLPSSIKWGIYLYQKYCYMMSRSWVNWEKIKILWFVFSSFGSILSSSSNLPDTWKIWSL